MFRSVLFFALVVSASASAAQPATRPGTPEMPIHTVADDYLERCVEHERARASQRKGRKGELSDAVVRCYREASGERPRRRLGR